MESIGVGTIKITGGKVIVSDPCYERDAWCAGTIENFPNGEYDCEVDVGIAGEWGKRVFRMRILKQGLNLSQCEFRHSDVLPVDCALMGFFDDAYHKETHPGKVSDEWYEVKVMQLEEDASIVDDRCFISSTGFDDGLYDVYELYDAYDNLVGIEAQFLTDEDEN